MAYYSSSYYDTGHGYQGEYYLTSYAHNPDDSASISYSSYEDPSFQNLLEYQYPNPTPYYHANYHSASAYSNPISIQYDPPKHYEQSYDTGVTQFLISYSVSSPEFNDPEIDDYDEYDPTPYGGGYSIDAQYGKPLPPSNETCYPRGGSSSPPDPKPSNLSGAIVPVSVGGNGAIADEQAAKPITEMSLPVQLGKEDEQQEKSEEQAKENGSLVLAIENGDDTESQGKTNQGEVYDSRFESGRGLYDQVPSGYGLEAMDICESLFGYWPCLARDLKRSNCESSNDQRFSCEDPWKGTADYLFGSSNPYMGERTTYYEYEDYRR
ncbi:PREDICTED: uncharacterized protein LOC101293080 [Fragaria vesca subsp. vesca]|uniref:uncharacterized protein LOC101293080 n=1 Tax=Fragaria vesca subsp. vesca TaxID=101020 RepID=UPI0002C31BA3|nr:PREDICTED: uncharacterized protein LOC101293080 [Fragaria vesca subsp. vesca]